MRRHAAVSLLGAALVALMTGCGTETDGDTAGTTEKTAAFDATTASVTDQPFCDRVDTSLVAVALGMTADRVKLLETREVGQKVEGPNEEGRPLTSEVNSCAFGSTTARFIVTVAPDASVGAVQETIDYYADLGHKGFSSEKCEVVEDAGFGDPGAVAGCHGTGGSRRMSLVATGLVGTSKYFCSTVLNDGGTASMRDATVDACRETLQTLAQAPS